MLFFLFSFQRSTPSREVLTYITKPTVFCQQLFKVFSFFCLLFAFVLDCAGLKFVTSLYFQAFHPFLDDFIYGSFCLWFVFLVLLPAFLPASADLLIKPVFLCIDLLPFCFSSVRLSKQRFYKERISLSSAASETAFSSEYPFSSFLVVGDSSFCLNLSTHEY